MKKIITSGIFLLICILQMTAQVPQRMNYQAVARNSAGNVLASQAMQVRFSIRSGSATGPVVYQEEHSTTTNAFGVFNLAVGGGTAITGTFGAVDWAGASKFLQVEIDPNSSGWISMGANELLSVPYAIHAQNGGINYTAGTGISTAGNVITNTGDTNAADDITNTSTAGGDLTGTFSNLQIATNAVGANELASSGVTAGTYGSSIMVPQITIDADGRITSASAVAVAPGGSNQWTVDGNFMYPNDAVNVGLGTSTPQSKLVVTQNSTASNPIAHVLNTNTSGVTNTSVIKGQNNSTTFAGYGVEGHHQGNGIGLYGHADGTFGQGVYGEGGIQGIGVNAEGGTGVYAESIATNGTAVQMHNGFLRVSGTVRSAFRTTATSVPSSNIALIYPGAQASDILILTPIHTGTPLIFPAYTITFAGSNWSAWTASDDGTPADFPAGTSFSFMVIKQ